MRTKPLIIICNIIIYLITPVLYFGLLAVLLHQGWNLGASFSMPLMYEMWVVLILMMGMVAVLILFFTLAYYTKKGKLFHPKNERNLIGFGIFIVLCGIAAAILTAIYSVNVLAYYAASIILFMGLLFVFFALILKITRKLQEEQELTI